MGIEVYVPCPISTLCIVNVTTPSGPMRMKELGEKALGGKVNPNNRPPPTAALISKKARRDSLGMERN
jgi:hypothetical protein